MFHRHHEKEQIIGTVVDYKILHPHLDPPHAHLYYIELRPKDAEPFMVEVHVSAHQMIKDFYAPQKGNKRRFVYDPASGKAEFDMTDQHNSWAAQKALADDLMSQVLEAEEDYS